MSKKAKRNILLALVILAFIYPNIQSAALCNSIRAGEKEEALTRIKYMWNVNSGTAPGFLRGLLSIMQSPPDRPLEIACQHGDLEIIEALLKRGADPNKAWNGHFTPVEAAVAGGEDELEKIELLVQYGADVTRRSGDYKSVLFNIAERWVWGDEEKKEYYWQCMKYLMERDANHVDSSSGYTLLHYAVIEEEMEFIEYLLQNEKELIDLREVRGGRTALHLAVEYNSLPAAELLLKYGADITITDAKGRTAYDFAVEMGSQDVKGFQNIAKAISQSAE